MEILSSDEIDALLYTDKQSVTEEENTAQDEKNGNIKINDLSKSKFFTTDQIRTISVKHETFERLSSVRLSAWMQADIQLNIVCVDQLTYRAFMESTPSNSVFAEVCMHPLNGSALIEIDAAASFTLVDIMKNGNEGMNGELAKTGVHSETEFGMLEKIIKQLLDNLRETWSSTIELRPRLVTINTNSELVQIASPSETVILITMEIKIGSETEKIINLCYPWLTLEPILHCLKL